MRVFELNGKLADKSVKLADKNLVKTVTKAELVTKTELVTKLAEFPT